MKYIKLFEDTHDDSNDKSIIYELKNLCQDLEDLSYDIEIRKYLNENNKKYYFSIIISKYDNKINIVKIRNTLYTLESYAKDELKLTIKDIIIVTVCGKSFSGKFKICHYKDIKEIPSSITKFNYFEFKLYQ